MIRFLSKNITLSGWIVLTIIYCLNTTCSGPEKSVFSKENITPWCIVPFDAKQRNPRERAEMLERLGLKTLAYDWRENNISEFDEEIIQLKKHGISMTAFWWAGGLPQSEEELKASEIMNIQLDFLKRNALNLDVWVTLSDYNLEDKTDEQKSSILAAQIDVLASELKEYGCRLGLYNHGGWGGQPKNMVETIKKVKSGNVGIVYNFHHAHEHLEMMPEAFELMLPYLYCVNLNGMNPGGPKILTLGQGEEDVKILKMIKESGYSGPIGIIGHIEDEDVEVVLKRNLDGLKNLLAEIGDTEALKTW
ncbi:MAG: TIM barrel protein [Bacteroidales bacterium]|nr:TIM barrel protein [Bacteroidales bacterium]